MIPIPIGDDNPSRTFPIITVFLILTNTLVFLFELSLGPGLEEFIRLFGFTPKEVISAFSQAKYELVLIPLFASMFLHGGWVHLIGNMLYLWIFGDNIEDRLGHLPFAAFYLLAGTLAMLAHLFSAPQSTTPAIGASGAIAGVLGAYLVLFPRARVFILIPLFLFFPVVSVPALVVLGFWFVEQLLNGTLALSQAGQVIGIAWWAHIGGFVAGIVLVRFFLRRRREMRNW